MMEQGHQVTLFCHEKVENVPERVEIRDAREVTGDRPVLMHLRDWQNKFSRFPSPALFADQFRYLMIKQLGFIWLDLDCFLLSPLKPVDGYLLAWQDSAFINNAILTLPKTSNTLNDLIDFCEDEYPIPPFVSFRWRFKLHFMMLVGKPIHITCQKWGVWGPRALTHFLCKNNEDQYALDRKLFYPIPPEDTDEKWRAGKSPFLLPSDEVKMYYIKDAISVHLFGSTINPRIKSMGIENIPRGSYLEEIIKYGE